MTGNGWLQIILYLVLLTAIGIPFGAYMERVFSRKRTWLDPALRPVERGIYAVCGVDETREQAWTGYAVSLLLFSVVGLLLTYAMLRLQNHLPLNPEKLPAVPDDLSFNTSVSFTTNTNWQSYSGESTMSYLSQMDSLATHNFMSAATGIAVAIALIRGFARRTVNEIGNFWVDLVRCTLWILLPICSVGALVLVSQGVMRAMSSASTRASWCPVTARRWTPTPSSPAIRPWRWWTSWPIPTPLAPSTRNGGRTWRRSATRALP